MCAYTPNRELILQRTVDAVHTELGVHDRLLIVVDHAPAYAVQLRARWRQATVIENTSRRGLSGARNTGVDAADADVVVFIDDDAVPRPGWAGALRSAFADRDCMVLGGAVHPLWQGRSAPPWWFPPEFGWVVGCDYLGMPEPGRPIRNPIGACMAIRRTAFDRAGRFTENLGRRGQLPAGCEETEFAIRLAAVDPRIRMFRDLSFAVDHEVSTDRQTLRYFLRRCFWEGRSKAAMADLVPSSTGLSAETRHATSVLPRAWLRDVGAIFRGRPRGPLRAGVSVAGLVWAAAGFGWTRITSTPRRDRRGGADVSVSGSSVPDSPPRMSVVVCTLGRSPHLDACIRSLLAQSHHDFEVVVVDNDPESGSAAEILDRHTDPRLRSVSEPHRGLSWARNRGLAAARGHVVAFTDDDARPDGNWLASLDTVFVEDSDQAIACVTGRVLPASVGSDVERWFETGIGFDKGETGRFWSRANSRLRPRGLSPDAEPGSKGPLYPISAGEFGSGNNMAFRREWLAHHGAFDARLGAGSPTRGGEDLDIFRRVVLSGSVLVYTPSALVYHHHRATVSALRRQVFGYGSGMAASVTRYALSGPTEAAEVLRALPQGLRTLLAPHSPKNRNKPHDYPRSLDLAERSGYLLGPLLFVAAALTRQRPRPANDRSARGHRA